jgi:hypothetical protein
VAKAAIALSSLKGGRFQRYLIHDRPSIYPFSAGEHEYWCRVGQATSQSFAAFLLGLHGVVLLPKLDSRAGSQLAVYIVVA